MDSHHLKITRVDQDHIVDWASLDVQELTYGYRKVGRPRTRWCEEVSRLAWKIIRYSEEYGLTAEDSYYKDYDTRHTEIMERAAFERKF
eukprot:11228308-Lingulodinium_polyedra.AAC.1